MTKIEWDGTGERFYETGTSQGVLYKMDTTGKYETGVAWNGLTTVSESPSGAEPTDLYADDIKYATIRSAEDFGVTIEAYTYPDEFAECDGSATITKGVYAGQQNRRAFGFTYKTKIGDDIGNEFYKLHIVYGATASPSEKSYSTINDSPDAITFSWEIKTTPINVPGFKPSATIVIDSREVPADALKDLEDILYGTEDAEPRLPLPSEIVEIFESYIETEIAG